MYRIWYILPFGKCPIAASGREGWPLLGFQGAIGGFRVTAGKLPHQETCLASWAQRWRDEPPTIVSRWATPDPPLIVYPAERHGRAPANDVSLGARCGPQEDPGSRQRGATGAVGSGGDQWTVHAEDPSPERTAKAERVALLKLFGRDTHPLVHSLFPIAISGEHIDAVPQ